MEKNTTVKEKKSFKQWLSDHKPTKRRIIQLYAALLTNANLKGFGNGKIYMGNVKGMCVPGLNCYSCPAASAACPLGALQNALAATKTRLPYYMVGILLLYGFLFGRWICGFLCPFGLIQDLLHKIKTPKLKKSRFTRVLSYLKYVILAVFVIIIPLTYALQKIPFTLPAFCKYICPSGTLLGAGGLLSNEANDYMFGMLGPLFTWKFLLLVVFIVGAIFIYRFFCRFFCPLGALYGLFNKISWLGMKVEQPKCTNCGLCVGQCEMDILHVGDQECISCGKCVNVCPTGAITYKGPKILLAPNEVGGKIDTAKLKTIDPLDAPGTELPKKTKIARLAVGIVMAAVLVGALVYYNFIDKAPSDPSVDPGTAEVGGDVGDLCYDYEMELYGSDGTVKPSDFRGKVTVINFWYTYCGPCVQELLTEFSKLEPEYGDQVEVLAVHTNEQYATDVNAFIEESFEGLNYTFCRDGVDEEGNKEVFVKMFGGGMAWPYTVILDQEGVIVSIIPRATTFSELKSIIDPLLDTKEGGKVGDLCYDYEMELYGTEGTVKPSAFRGKITVINFWYTYCGPCVQELLTEFPKLDKEYGDKVAVLAVHTNEQYETDVNQFIADSFADMNYTFCRDGADEDGNKEIFVKLLGGGMSWPHTVILDENGIIVSIIPRSTTFDELKSVIDPLLAD